MTYKGNINYNSRKICCIIAGIISILIFREFYLIYLTMFLYSDILICERLSYAILNKNSVIIKKHYIFGFIRRESSYNLIDPEGTIDKVFESIPTGYETFSLESLNNISKSKIIFHVKNNSGKL